MNNKGHIVFIFIVILLTTCSIVFIYSNQKNDVSIVSDISSDSPDITPKSQVELEYYIWKDEESYILPVVEAYQAMQSSVRINLHVMDSDYYENNIKVLFSTRTKIDLLGVRGISLMVQFLDRDYLLDLTSYIANNDLDVTAYGSMFNDIAIDGKYYGIPTRSTCWVLFYNKDLFDDAGISYPKQMTWDEYRSLAKLLTNDEGESKIYGGYWVPWCYNFAALQRSFYLIDDNLTYTRESLELLNDFYNIDGSHMSYRQLMEQKIDIRKEFEKGTIAMLPQGEWMVNMLMEDEKKGLSDINWDIAPMPIFEGQEPGITWGQYQFVSIGKNTAYPEEAFDFVQFLCGEEGARIFAENGIIHAYSNDKIKKIYLNTVGKESASIFYEAKKVQEEYPISGYEEIKEAFKKCAKEYFLGNKTLDETMEKFEALRSEILSEQ